MKSAIKFESVKDRIEYKKREAARLRREREIMEESDRSIAGLVFYGAGSVVVLFMIFLCVISWNVVHKSMPTDAGRVIVLDQH